MKMKKKTFPTGFNVKEKFTHEFEDSMWGKGTADIPGDRIGKAF